MNEMEVGVSEGRNDGDVGLSDRERDEIPSLPGWRVLEERITAATSLIARLKDENHALEGEKAELLERVRSLDSDERKQMVRELEGKIGSLERERGDLLQEKRAISRRIEDILEKLKFLES